MTEDWIWKVSSLTTNYLCNTSEWPGRASREKRLQQTSRNQGRGTKAHCIHQHISTTAIQQDCYQNRQLHNTQPTHQRMWALDEDFGGAARGGLTTGGGGGNGHTGVPSCQMKSAVSVAHQFASPSYKTSSCSGGKTPKSVNSAALSWPQACRYGLAL